jgi:hypothetical protein
MSQSPTDVGVWRDTSDPATHAVILLVGGHLLFYCTAFNETAGMVEVDLAEPNPGKRPSLMVCDGDFVKCRLHLGEVLEVYWDGAAHPNNGPRYWTESGWVNDRSEPIGGPIPGIVEAYVAGEALLPDQAVTIRNGKVYRA